MPNEVDTRLFGRRQAGASWWALGPGLFALLVATVELSTHMHTAYISWVGIAAVINGIVALRSRARGGRDKPVPAIIGIAAGAVGTAVLAIVFFGSAFTQPYTSMQQIDDSSASNAGAGSTSGSGTSASAASDAMPSWLSSYGVVTVQNETSAAAYFSQLTAPPTLSATVFNPADPSGVETYFQGQLASARSVLHSGTSENPASLALDATTHTLFVPSTCQAPATVPDGVIVRYALSPAGTNVALEFGDETEKVGAIWTSQDDTLREL